MKSRNEYIELRRRYEPENAALVIIAKSPPASGRYFYDPAGAVTEPLFAELMRAFQLSPVTKDEGLRAFQRAGLVLIDATYEPVNQGHRRSDRDAVIARDYVLLRDDLAAFGSIPLVLIKENVCRVLEPKLVADGFNVLNRGRPIYFPSHGRQTYFRRQFREVTTPSGE